MSVREGFKSVLCLLLSDEFHKCKSSVTSELHRESQALDLQNFKYHTIQV